MDSNYADALDNKKFALLELEEPNGLKEEIIKNTLEHLER